MKKLIIHVGAPKCGSSALQSALEVYEKSGVLSEYSIHYPLNYSRGLGNGNASFLFEECSNYNKFEGEFPKSLEFLSNISESTIILSDETLYETIIPSMEKLSKNLGEIFDEIYFIVAFREPSSWLLSDFSQYIKMNVSSDDFIKHVAKREYVCDWYKYVRRLIVQNSSFKIVTTDYRNLFSCFEDLLGLDEGFIKIDQAKSNSNFSLLPRVLEAKRIMNSLGIHDSDKELILRDSLGIPGLNISYWSLLEYVSFKYSGYEEKISNHENVTFYKAAES